MASSQKGGGEGGAGEGEAEAKRRKEQVFALCPFGKRQRKDERVEINL